MLSIPNKLTLHTRIHIILVAWVSFFPPAVSEHVFLRNTQEDLWLSTWFLEARKAFILKLRRLGWIPYYYFAIMQQLDRAVKWLDLSEREANFHTKHCLYLDSSSRSYDTGSWLLNGFHRPWMSGRVKPKTSGVNK
ncbi:hypothetical protein NC651_029823 [Populus alba x Populus x berolinensis]|nr:hypothetical protein NC651_029823 [Populus alba x Populus x berolinensis]